MTFRRPRALRVALARNRGSPLSPFFNEAEAAMRRIAQLLEALREYTHRDRMREMGDVDIREGIESTLALYNGRARGKGVDIELVVQ